MTVGKMCGLPGSTSAHEIAISRQSGSTASGKLMVVKVVERRFMLMPHINNAAFWIAGRGR